MKTPKTLNHPISSLLGVDSEQKICYSKLYFRYD